MKDYTLLLRVILAVWTLFIIGMWLAWTAAKDDFLLAQELGYQAQTRMVVDYLTR